MGEQMDGDELWEIGVWGTDADWFKATGQCGYCGQDCGCGGCGEPCRTCPEIRGVS
ncbi:hypothetical protein GCM10027456_25730 [Kineosporia babensis]